MEYSTDMDTLWSQWENSVLNYGFDAKRTQALCAHIEELESRGQLKSKSERREREDVEARAHRILDRLCAKRRHLELHTRQPGQPSFKTPFGAVYQDPVVVRGVERLLAHSKADSPALRLCDGFYHVNYLPGVQPNASDIVNARNKNVERINLEVVEQFVDACKETGMQKRGWKKAVNKQFDITRQEFTKWLTRYFPHFGLEVPIQRREN